MEVPRDEAALRAGVTRGPRPVRREPETRPADRLAAGEVGRRPSTQAGSLLPEGHRLMGVATLALRCAAAATPLRGEEGHTQGGPGQEEGQVAVSSAGRSRAIAGASRPCLRAGPGGLRP